MFDFAWSEIMIIGLVALVVIGPKDLPRFLKTAGFWVRKARGMAREFQNSVDDMIRESELDEFRKSVDTLRRTNVNDAIAKAVDPTGEVRAAIEAPNETATDLRPVEPPPEPEPEPGLIEAPVDPTVPPPAEIHAVEAPLPPVHLPPAP